VDRGILLLVTPLQSRMARLARSIGHAAGQYVDLVHVRAENETLRNDNNRLRAELLEAKRGAAESVRFQRLLACANRRDRGNPGGAGDRHRRLTLTSAWHASSSTAVRPGQPRHAHHHTRRCGGSDQPRRG